MRIVHASEDLPHNKLLFGRIVDSGIISIFWGYIDIAARSTSSLAEVVVGAVCMARIQQIDLYVLITVTSFEGPL